MIYIMINIIYYIYPITLNEQFFSIYFYYLENNTYDINNILNIVVVVLFQFACIVTFAVETS